MNESKEEREREEREKERERERAWRVKRWVLALILLFSAVSLLPRFSRKGDL